MKVVSSIRYLGTDAGDSILCFGECQKGKIWLAEKMANLTFSIIARSCNKMVIGKTYWKSVVQPRVLSATAVMVWTGGGRWSGCSGFRTRSGDRYWGRRDTRR